MNITRESMGLPASLDVCKMRPTQLLTLAGAITGVALIALGLSTGGFLGFLALGVGAGLGYLSYNSFQVLTNLDQMAKAPMKTAHLAVGRTIASTVRNEGFFTAATNLFSGQMLEDCMHDTVGQNTLFFEWAVARVAESLRQQSTREIGTLLNDLDNDILNCFYLKV